MSSSAVDWSGGFEPFGADYSGASDAGVFLRFPGQWADRSWEASGSGAEFTQNLFRWYLGGAGQYSQVDPLGPFGSLRVGSFAYSEQNPLSYADPTGLETCFVFNLSHVADLGRRKLFLAGHVGLIIKGDCGIAENRGVPNSGNGSCTQPSPTIFDPSGSYRERQLGSGRMGTIANIPGAGFDDYTRYQCDSKKGQVEVVCFQTTCCEENTILERASEFGGGGFAQCATGISYAVGGVGPFGEIDGSIRPSRLRRQIASIFLQYNRPARYQRLLCN